MITLLVTSLDQSLTLDHNERYSQIQIITQTKEYKQLNTKEQLKKTKSALKKANKDDLAGTNIVSKFLAVGTAIILSITIVGAIFIYKANKELKELYTYRRTLEEQESDSL